MIGRLNSISSSSSSSEMKKNRKISMKKPIHDDQSDGSTSVTTSSPPVKRISRRNSQEKNKINENLTFHQNHIHHDIIKENKFDHNRQDISTGIKRTASGTTVSL